MFYDQGRLRSWAVEEKRGPSGDTQKPQSSVLLKPTRAIDAKVEGRAFSAHNVGARYVEAEAGFSLIAYPLCEPGVSPGVYVL